MITLPSDVLNRMVDALGSSAIIGDLSDGTVISEWARRNYLPTLKQLLRAAHWSFARKRGELQLLGDRLGTTLSPQGAAISAKVEPPWQFAYAWPIDGVQARWMPWCGDGGDGIPSGNIAIQPPPMLTGMALSPLAGREVPARFLCSTSDQFPVLTGQADWERLPDIEDIEGVGLRSRRIVLTNVPQAHLVYTALILEPDMWDSLFSEGLVNLLASRAALLALVDTGADMGTQAKQRQAALAVRGQQIALAKDAIMQARVASANEAGFPQSVSHEPDWIRARRVGGGMWSGGWGDGGPGYSWCGWEGMSFADGSVF